MQLTLFRTPPPERRRQSASVRVGGPSVSKRGLEVRLQRRADAPEIKSAAGLSFLKPAPSLEKEGKGEVEAKAALLDRRVVELSLIHI